jgi:hypothetical protein
LTKRLTQLALILLAVAICWKVYWDHRYKTGFAKITAGTSKNEVVTWMGNPWKDEQCGSFSGRVVPACAEELVYADPLAPVLPAYWIIRLDANKRVVGSYFTTSP